MKSVIERNGTENIILPETMTHEEAISRISADRELLGYGEREVTIEEIIPRFPFEAAHALSKATKELHGATIGHDVPLPDGGVIRNKLIGVPISATENVQVPWGPFHLPDVEGSLETVQVVENGMIVMKLVARVKRKYGEKIKVLADRTRELADKESIYRGKAIMVKFRDERGELDVAPPSFMDLSGDHTVIFSHEVMREVSVNVLVPIKHAELAKKLNIPTKRGILLVGTYGSGKTLTARWMAKESTNIGRTFIYVKDASELGDALRFASLYSPSMIFAEDIDRVMFGLRTQEMDQMLNTVDGVDTKNVDIITVLTTNNLNMIHPAFLREGRMDTIIQIDKPDLTATEALVRHFGGNLIVKSEKLNRLSSLLQEHSPAFIREVVERSKLEKLLDLNNGDIESIRLTAQDLELAFHHHSKEREQVDVAMKESDMLAQFAQHLKAHGLQVRMPQ
ncbi:MAG TPA: ATP-binding protein [Candidatus Andersenbacteria bacterium]|nr:ATP-binding protein [Candidatus Andersenbacteria bacterium]